MLKHRHTVSHMEAVFNREMNDRRERARDNAVRACFASLTR
jgi:hypothetical protein